jgi:sterol desaturase/sphingolipid hydroxylase (fatty acid hydroxylase superfamily)
LFYEHPSVPLGIWFVARLAFWTFVERVWPARFVDVKAVFFADLAAGLTLFFAIIPLSDALTYRILPSGGWVPAELIGWPILARVAAYIVLADLGHYWIHRLLHTPLFWRCHKWHHSPTHMNWLAGSRESLPDRFLVGLPYITLWPILNGGPWWLSIALLAFAGLKNDWMHVNTSWRTGWLEWLIVSPRYHHVHHSSDSAHYTRNLAPLFSVWDRVFGTYRDPSTVPADLRFGIGERVPLARLIAGL